MDPNCTTTAGASATCTTPSATNIHTAGAHNELLIMWKPVRLQGVGAASSVLDANAFPSGKLMDPWRRHINCLFGLTLQGFPATAPGGATPYDPSGTFNCPDPGWAYFTGQPNAPQIDRLPLEAVTGWDATVNGNLAEQLQEPSLMGAYEGAGITVLGKGVYSPPGENYWSDGSEAGAFPGDASLLQDTGNGVDDEGLPLIQSSHCADVPNPYPSNFMCNPSSIDGLSVTNSSQGGGGIFVHGWAHNLQIANNRIYNNAGTLSGGITVGQGESPCDRCTSGGRPRADSAPGFVPTASSCGTHGRSATAVLPGPERERTQQRDHVDNSSIGDELFSGTLAGGGGVSFCTGSDYYKFNYNWVCGNMSAGEGGGVAHLGYI